MGFKPQTFGDSISNNFSEYNKPVSICIDQISNMPDTSYKVLLHIEPPEIHPNFVYDIIDNKDKFDLILTWDTEVLAACPNSVRFPFGTSWISDHSVSHKKCAVSFLASSKNSTVGHQVRYGIFSKLPPKIGNIDIIKHMSPPFVPKKDQFLKPFEYSIIIENARRPNWFTEKLIDCLITKTIPIYWGCPNIGEYFDIQGIMSFTTYDEIERFIGSITPNTYLQKQDITERNYQLALEYTNIWTRVDKLIKEIIG